ncbi:MAG: DUF1015 domain-containing protein [bacterium]
MADIIPFKGLRYNLKKISDIAKVVTPPYDVISQEAQEAYYLKSDYNIIRLILGKELPEDSESINKYTRASGFYKEWTDTGVLKQDEKPGIYIYEQCFGLEDINEGEGRKSKCRRGFICLVKLEDFRSGKILPHEVTYSGPKQDRLELMRRCKANFSPIFGLYDDKEMLVDKNLQDIIEHNSPILSFTDSDGIVNKVWLAQDTTIIKNIQDRLKSYKIFIADGHHRYETALFFRDEMSIAIEKNSAYDYVMMMLINVEDKGLCIFPTHRLLKNITIEKDDFIKKIERYFEIKSFKFSNVSEEVKQRKILFQEMESKDKQGLHCFGVLYKGDFTYYILTLKDNKLVDDLLVSDEMSQTKRYLDVVILQKVIFEQVLGLSELTPENIFYEARADRTVTSVMDGKAQIAFLLNPTKIEEVKKIAQNGEKMPPKSTYFYPKLTTGVVVNPLVTEIK